MRIAVLVALLLLVACPPADVRRCNAFTDCLALQDCVDGVCVDVAAEGEGEGDGEGEGENLLPPTGPAFVPIDVAATITLASPSQEECQARSSIDGDVGRGADDILVTLRTVGDHDVSVTCGALTTPPLRMTAWTITSVDVSPAVIAAGEPTQIFFTVSPGTVDVVCDVTETSRSAFAPPAPVEHADLANGDAIAPRETSTLSSSCVNAAAPELAVAAPPAIIEMSPAPATRVRFGQDDVTGDLEVVVRAQAADVCRLFQNGSTPIGSATARTSVGQDEFALLVDPGALSGAMSTEIVCFAVSNNVAGPTTGARVSLFGGDVTDDAALIAARDAEAIIGAISAGAATEIVLPALEFVFGSIAVTCQGSTLTSIALPALTGMTGSVEIRQCAGLSSVQLGAPSSGLVLNDVIIEDTATQLIDMRALAVVGDLVITSQPRLEALSAPALGSVSGNLLLAFNTPIGCVDLVALVCQLDPNPAAIAVDVRDGQGVACALDPSCVD